VVAIAMPATNIGEGAMPAISQPAPALCIQPPMLETTLAIQISRKAGTRKGAKGDSPPGGGVAAGAASPFGAGDWSWGAGIGESEILAWVRTVVPNLGSVTAGAGMAAMRGMPSVGAPTSSSGS
jgi:hypothetical protein